MRLAALHASQALRALGYSDVDAATAAERAVETIVTSGAGSGTEGGPDGGVHRAAAVGASDAEEVDEAAMNDVGPEGMSAQWGTAPEQATPGAGGAAGARR